MATLAALEPGTMFAGDYRVVRKLSEGGMGAVYVVEQKSTGKERALKLMLPALVADQTLRTRFEQEARVGARIESEHVVEVQAAGVDVETGLPYLVMELLRGEDFSTHLTKSGPLDPSTLLTIFDQLGHAIGAAHRAGIIHRDIKPENIFLARSKRAGQAIVVKVLDFGIAKIAAEAEAKSKSTAAMGSPMWMAPEQTERGAVTAAADVWALGLVAFFALTGKAYWRAANDEGTMIAQLMREILFEPMPPASERAREYGRALPPWFDEWFAKTTARDPKMRLPDANAAIDELGRLARAAPALPVALGGTVRMDPPPPAPIAPRPPTPTPASYAQPTPAPKPSSSTGSQGVPGMLIAVGAFLFVAIGVGIAAVLVSMSHRDKDAASSASNAAITTDAAVASASPAPSASAPGASAAIGPINDATRFYVYLYKVKNQTTHKDAEITPAVLDGLSKTFATRADTYFSPTLQDAAAANAAVGDRHPSIYELTAEVSFEEGKGERKAQLRVAIFALPGRDLKGQVSPTITQKIGEGVDDLELVRVAGQQAGKSFLEAFAAPGVTASNAPAAGGGQGAPAANTKKAKVAIDAPEVEGSLAPDVVLRIARQNTGTFRLCYERELRSSPELAGRVTVKFVVDRNGSVLTTQRERSSIDEIVTSCVVRAFGNLSFPAPGEGGATVVISIDFSTGP